MAVEFEEDKWINPYESPRLRERGIIGAAIRIGLAKDKENAIRALTVISMAAISASVIVFILMPKPGVLLDPYASEEDRIKEQLRIIERGIVPLGIRR